MRYQSILKRLKIRISAAIGVGIFFKFFTDMVFGLLYKNYEVLQPLGGYIQAIGLALLAFLLFYQIEIWLNKRLPWEKHITKRFLVQLLLEVLVVFILFIALRWLILFLFYKNSLVVITDELILISTVLLVAFFYNSINLGSYLLFQWRNSAAEVERFKKENAESKFEALQNQVNPHFLFNSLNTLSSLMFQDVDAASNYIRQLAQVYRYVLENSSKELVSLAQELEFVNSYEYLLTIRFADKIRFNLAIDDAQRQKRIAPMTLQILIENAVKHNVVSTKKPLVIQISASENWLVVENNLQPKPAEGNSLGHGLKNIKSRYKFLTQSAIVITQTEQKFEVRIPMIN